MAGKNYSEIQIFVYPYAVRKSTSAREFGGETARCSSAFFPLLYYFYEIMAKKYTHSHTRCTVPSKIKQYCTKRGGGEDKIGAEKSSVRVCAGVSMFGLCSGNGHS